MTDTAGPDRRPRGILLYVRDAIPLCTRESRKQKHFIQLDLFVLLLRACLACPNSAVAPSLPLLVRLLRVRSRLVDYSRARSHSIQYSLTSFDASIALCTQQNETLTLMERMLSSCFLSKWCTPAYTLIGRTQKDCHCRPEWPVRYDSRTRRRMLLISASKVLEHRHRPFTATNTIHHVASRCKLQCA